MAPSHRGGARRDLRVADLRGHRYRNVGGVHGGVVESARLWIEAGKIRYFSSFRVWVVKVTILFFGQRERPAEGRPAGRELTRDASSLAKDRKGLFD